jgi:hypothetical protein
MGSFRSENGRSYWQRRAIIGGTQLSKLKPIMSVT